MSATVTLRGLDGAGTWSSPRGHQFTTFSDTEVVLREYLEWGDGVAERLNGMVAFAVWDVRKKEIALVRDRIGIKPPFYYPLPDRAIGADGLRRIRRTRRHCAAPWP